MRYRFIQDFIDSDGELLITKGTISEDIPLLDPRGQPNYFDEEYQLMFDLERAPYEFREVWMENLIEWVPSYCLEEYYTQEEITIQYTL